MNLSKILFGGAGPVKNASRREIIDDVKEALEMWRNFDEPSYLAKARRLLDEAE